MALSKLRYKARLGEAVVILVTADLAVRTLPFRMLAPMLGKIGSVSPTDIGTLPVQRSIVVGRAVASAARHLPHRPACLAQSIAVQIMLRRRGIDGTVIFGVTRDTDTLPSWLAAHAWVRVGKKIIIGRDDHKNFRVIAQFAASGVADYE